MLRGKIVLNRTFIGILYGNNIYVKLGMKDMASQVIDNDIVDFVLENKQGIVKNIIERNKQPFIGIITKTDSHSVYINLPLLNPISSIRINKSNIGFDLKFNDCILGWLDINNCFVQQSVPNDKELIEKYYIELGKLDIKLFSKNNFINDKTDYVDLTYLETFHVDPEGCEDIDDFISIDKNERKVYLHIVDISHYIAPGSKDDINGIKYGNTWYFPDFTKHLYNKFIDYDFLYCLTLEIRFNEDDHDIQFYKSKIHCKFDFDYSYLQLIFDKKLNHPIQKDLLWSLNKLETLYLPPPSNVRRLKWISDNDRFIPSYEEELLSHRYISGWMIFYNSWIGKNIKIDNNILPQRHHPVKDILQIKNPSNKLPLEIQYMILVKQYRQAEYNEFHHGHFGLNREYYTHSSSPLRRYFDRLIQYRITYGKNYNFSEDLLDHLNFMEKLSERISQWYITRIMNKFIIDNPEKIYECYLIEKSPFGSSYYIYDLKEIVFEHGSVNQQIGEKFLAKLSIVGNKIIILKIF
jgi:hypothetical protein